MPLNDVLYNISYSNIILFHRVIPVYGKKDEKSENKKTTENTSFGGLLSILKSHSNAR